MKQETAESVVQVGGCAIFLLGMAVGTYWGFDWAWRLARGHSGISWWIVFLAVWSFVTPFLTWAISMSLGAALGTVMAIVAPKSE
jgi:hypothetical protein